MPLKKTAKKKPAVKKALKKKPNARRGDVYKCGVCGYRIVVDAACGCAEEHIFICCEKPMKKRIKAASRA